MTSGEVSGQRQESLLTVAAIGVLAFVATDAAHEVVGHGIGLLLAGGRAGTLTTTKLIAAEQLPAPLWRVFDLGGPLGNLAWAVLCMALQRLTGGARPRWRLFLWAGAMFALFWEFGYLMKCGVSGHGDGMALIEGLEPAGLWRALLFLTGLIVYSRAIQFLAAELHFVVSAGETGWRPRVRRLCWALYLAGGVTACAGAVFDPRGPSEILSAGAATSFIACLGLVLVPARFGAFRDRAVASAGLPPRSLPLVGLAVAVFLFFVLGLGRGIRVSL